MECVFCGNNSVIPFYEQNIPLHIYAMPKERLKENILIPLRISVCEKCGLGFSTSPLTDEQLTNIYDSYVCIDPFINVGHTKFNAIIGKIEKYIPRDSGLVEIGCSNGYLLQSLSNAGYTNLRGIEPSHEADIAISHGFNVKKDYFSHNSYENVDVFVLSHVFEHFADPFAIFNNMVNQLSNNGKIILETPNFSGFHHQHLFFYSLIFYIQLAEKFNMFLIDTNVDENGIIAVFAKHGKHCEVNESIEDVINKAKAVKSEQAECKKYFEDILKKHKKLHIWGTGSMLMISICQIPPELLDKCDIVLLDSQKNREGQYIMGVNNPVRHSLSIANSHIEAMLIASQFEKEIKDTMSQNNIIAEHTYSLFSKSKS